MDKKLPESDIGQKNLIFNKEYLKQKGDWSWGKGQKKDKIIFCKKLEIFSALTCIQFRCSGAKLKAHRNSKLRAPNNLSLDIADTQIYQFRINRKIRVLGYLIENTFYIVWIDWNHESG